METWGYPKCNIFPELPRFKLPPAQFAEASGRYPLSNAFPPGSGDANTGAGGSIGAVPDLARTLSKPARRAGGAWMPRRSPRCLPLYRDRTSARSRSSDLNAYTMLARGRGLGADPALTRAC